jgi:hypothetical protein
MSFTSTKIDIPFLRKFGYKSRVLEMFVDASILVSSLMNKLALVETLHRHIVVKSPVNEDQLNNHACWSSGVGTFSSSNINQIE